MALRKKSVGVPPPPPPPPPPCASFEAGGGPKKNSMLCPPFSNSWIRPWSIDCYTGWPRNNWTVDTVNFQNFAHNQQLFSSPCWKEHIFPIIITPRSSNLVENFLFYETFLMGCHYRDLPDFQSFEARWQINGKSQKWQSIRNYS